MKTRQLRINIPIMDELDADSSESIISRILREVEDTQRKKTIVHEFNKEAKLSLIKIFDKYVEEIHKETSKLGFTVSGNTHPNPLNWGCLLSEGNTTFYYERKLGSRNCNGNINGLRLRFLFDSTKVNVGDGYLIKYNLDNFKLIVVNYNGNKTYDFISVDHLIKSSEDDLKRMLKKRLGYN